MIGSKTQSLVILGAGFAAVLSSGGCASEKMEDPRRHLLSEWVDAVLIKDYRSVVALSRQLQVSSDSYCQSPDPVKWQQMTRLWWQLRAPWKHSETFGFGPVSQQPWRLGSKIDFWPVRPKTIEKTLAATELDLSPETVASLGASATGMPALEYLMFRPGAAQKAKDPRTCRYISSLAQDLVKDSGALLHAWVEQGENFRAQVLYADASTATFKDLDDALSQVVNRIGFTLENIRRDKLKSVMGDGKGGAHPTSGESQWSGRAIEDIRDNLRGMERLVFGSKGRFSQERLKMNRSEWTGFPTSLVQMLEYRGFYFHRSLQERFSACYAALDAIPGPLANAAKENPASIQSAIDALGQLQAMIQSDVLKGLALSMTFNDADGD